MARSGELHQSARHWHMNFLVGQENSSSFFKKLQVKINILKNFTRGDKKSKLLVHIRKLAISSLWLFVIFCKSLKICFIVYKDCIWLSNKHCFDGKKFYRGNDVFIRMNFNGFNRKLIKILFKIFICYIGFIVIKCLFPLAQL